MAPVGRRAPVRDAPTTIGLLLVGLYTTVQSVDAFRRLPETLATDYRTSDIGVFHGQALAGPIGIVACGVQILSLVIAIGFSVPRIRDRRSSWWIPLVSAAVCWLLCLVLFVIAAVAGSADMAELLQYQSRS